VIRVFIVAASPLVRAGLQSALAESRFEIVGTATNLELLSGRLVEADPDVVLIQTVPDGQEDLRAAIEDSEVARDFAIVVLSEQAKAEWHAKAIRAGVRAILPREVTPEQLRGGLEAVAMGLVVVHPADVESVLPVAANSSTSLEELLEPLTPREREVLQLLAAGLVNKEIASRLAISEHTVKFHVASILGKLGVSTRTEAVSAGIRRGLVLL